MTSLPVRWTKSFAAFLKQTCAKTLLVAQAIALTPLSQLSAEVTSITIEVQKPMDQMWPDFDSSQEGLVLLVDRLERTAHFLQNDEYIDPQAVRELRQLVIRLAQFGTIGASFEDTNTLLQDIIELLTNEEEGTDPCILWENATHFLGSSTYLELYSLDELAYLRCGFWKSAKKAVKRCAHKVEKFIRHHKKEILIGAGAVIIVGGIVYIAGACAAEAAAATAGAAAAASSDNNKKSSEKNNSSESPSKEVQLIEEISHLKDALNSAELAPCNDGSNKSDPLDPELIDYVRHASAKIAHDIWREIGKTGTLVLESEEAIEKLGSAMLPDELIAMLCQEEELLTSASQTQENWKNHIARGHQKIDEWFRQSIPFDEELQARLEEKFITGTPPLPIGGNPKLLNDVKKTSQIANLVKSTQEGATIVEKVAIMNRSQYAINETTAIERQISSTVAKATVNESHGIRIRLDGIWEIESQNIKKFDMKTFNAQKTNHIFNNEEHQLERFRCSKNTLIEQVTRSVIEADMAGKIPLNKDFSVRLVIDGLEVEVRGIVLDGELRYGTFFIPEGK